MLVKFLLKRVALLAILAAITIFFLDGVSIPAGILVGSCVGVYRTRLFSIFMGAAVVENTRTSLKSTLFYALSQVGVLALLAVAIMADLRFFLGISGGLLLLPMVICINGVTEKLGITHNEWGHPA